MKYRCLTSTSPDYKNYGGRGITICERWFILENFLEDMAPMPKKGLTLGRIDNNRNYCRENCRWISVAEQARNKQNTRWVVFKGKKERLADLCKRFGANWTTVNNRLRRGVSIELAVRKGIIR